MDENLKKIKEIIVQTAKEMNIEIDRIILFGSRARGDYREDSDYDLLIVTKEKLDRKTKYKFIENSLKKWNELRLAQNIQYDLHLIMCSKQYFEKYKDYIGDVVGFANKEGIII
ncbi:MAG: nucleotidyltransferase domain-containing protein [Candidatus Aenigmatarchaeota archaeon]